MSTHEAREIVRFLDTYAISDIATIRRRHPNEHAILKSEGRTLGDTDAIPAALIDTTKVMLGAVVESARLATTEVKDKLASARKLELAGSCVTILASGGVIAASIWSDPEVATIILATLGLLGSLVPLFVNWIRGSITNPNILTAFVSAREISWNAQAFLAKLIRPGFKFELATIDEANEIARSARVVLEDLGYEPTFSPQ